MLLTNAEITDYKSIRNSNPFEVGGITCLVGKNESGKTTLLEALYRLNPVIPEQGKFDITDDYPRADVEDYQIAVEKKQRNHSVVVRATFTLEDVDLVEMNKIAPNILSGRTVVVSKGYDNVLVPELELDEAAAIKAILADTPLPESTAAEASKFITLAELAAFLKANLEAINAASAGAQASANALADPLAKAKALEDAKVHAETQNTKWLRETVTAMAEAGLSEYLWENYLEDRLPKFLYFDDYYQMEGQVNIDALKQRQADKKLKPSDRPMLGLIDLARLNIDQLLTPGRTQLLMNKLEGASNHLSKQVLKYWSQNKNIQMRFDVRPALSNDPEGMKSGTNLWGLVHDSVHQASTGLRTRSRGFIWFFSFLAWYSQQKKATDKLILLLDEPGLFLHASAQGDFLRYMEAELAPYHQVLYTTHSPFLVDAKYFDRVRIVEDKSMTAEEELPLEERGTKVTSDVLEVSEASLFPLQGALGYEIAQTLFIGPNSLIVEGVSDLLYLQTLSALMQEVGREGLRAEWIITPVGGAEKVSTFVSLIGPQRGMNVAALIDVQKKDEQNIENLYKRKLLQKSHVLTFGQFTGKREADIEDMFDVDFYLSLVNEEYKSDFSGPITVASLKGISERVLVKITDVVKADPKKPSFNHYRPARFFSEKIGKLKGKVSASTLDRFETVFKALNALIVK